MVVPNPAPALVAAPHPNVGAALEALLGLLEDAGLGRWQLTGADVPVARGAIRLAVPGHGGDVHLQPRPDDAAGFRLLDGAKHHLLLDVARIVATVVAADRHTMAVEEKAARAERESATDPLTGAANARAWWRALERHAGHCDAQARSAVVAVVDLDELKLVNDQRGHLAGDQLLRAAADALGASVGEHDHVARVGGDEFGVLLLDPVAPSLPATARRLEAALAAAGVRASVGVARYEPGDRINDTYHRADREMYRVKATRTGRRATVA